MKVAVVGCSHGELDAIYEAIEFNDRSSGSKTELLLCCGDFQCTRDLTDLESMACQPHKRHMRDFYKYYNGEKTAPVLTIFIGGNHEATNFISKMPFGGWVAPNIFYMGRCNVIEIYKGTIFMMRLGGFSGIYKHYNYRKGIYETAPFDENTKRSIYHTRKCEIDLMQLLEKPIDVFMSHDWPCRVVNHTNVEEFCKKFPAFKDEVMTGRLGNPGTQILLDHLQPRFWFAGHLHCVLKCEYKHSNKNITNFVALSKPGRNRHFIDFIDYQPTIEKTANYLSNASPEKLSICYDCEWMTIVEKNYKNIPYNIIDSFEYKLQKPSTENINILKEKVSKEWYYVFDIHKDCELQHRKFLQLLSLSVDDEEIDIE